MQPNPFELEIEGVPFSTLNTSLYLAIKAYAHIMPNQENMSAGYFTVMSAVDGRLLLLMQVGECKAEKFAKYSALSVEKAQRLFKNRERHWSSWESRDPKALPYGMWGGAVRSHSLILSFSGFLEEGDEVVMLMTAIRSGFLTSGQAEVIANLSGNLLFQKMLMLIDP